jgi:hypothetical protein
MRKDCLDHYRVFDSRDDAHRAAADCAGLDVDAEHALQASGAVPSALPHGARSAFVYQLSQLLPCPCPDRLG